MSDSHTEFDYASIETWEELRNRKKLLQSEMNQLGGQIASSTREVVRKGVKVTAATVASVVVAKGIAAYADMRRKKENRSSDPLQGAPDMGENRADDSAYEPEAHGYLTTLVMYIDILVKLIHSARDVYDGIQEFRSELMPDEEE